MIEYLYWITFTALVSLYQVVPGTMAKIDPNEVGGSDPGSMKVRDNQTEKKVAERAAGPNYKTGKAEDAYVVDIDAINDPNETKEETEEAYRKGEFSIPQEESEALTKVGLFGTQDRIDELYGIHDKIIKTDAGAKEETSTLISGDGKVLKEGDQTAAIGPDVYKQRMTEPFGRKEKPENGDTVHVTNVDMNKLENGAKAKPLLPKAFDPNSKKFSKDPPEGFIGDPIQS